MKSVICLLGGALFVFSAVAQEPIHIGVKSKTEVRAAEIDVLVLDRHGDPVVDLAREEFRLFVDGKEKPIDWIEAPSGRSLNSSANDGAGAAEEASARESPSVLRRHSTVIVVNDLTLSIRDRLDGLEGVRGFLLTLPPGEEVALYSFGSGLKLCQRFTTDRALVAKAIDRIEHTLPSTDLSGLIRSDTFIASLSYLFRNLANRTEPKTVVILAGQVRLLDLVQADGVRRPFSVDRVASNTRDSMSTALDDSGRKAFVSLSAARFAANEALLARATVVALDPTGLTFGGDASTSTRSEGTDSFGFRNDSLALLAHETGGERLGFSNRPGQLLLAEAKRLNRRYRIGFTPPDKGSARSDIRVEVSRRGLTVRAASGQRTLTGEALARARFAGALIGAMIADSDFTLTLLPRTPPPKKGKERVVSVDVMIPIREFFLQERENTLVAELEFFVAAVDTEGRPSAVENRPFHLEVPSDDREPLARAVYRYPATYRIKGSGKGRLIVGLRDTATNRLGQAIVPFGD